MIRLTLLLKFKTILAPLPTQHISFWCYCHQLRDRNKWVQKVLLQFCFLFYFFYFITDMLLLVHHHLTHIPIIINVKAEEEWIQKMCWFFFLFYC